ncbi:MAG: hypothetical protein OXH00_02825 [Candidatus Poribacteria bacterium]|nr:hypothetical protein [Candidatus Poribacteria bacterium]
MLQVDSKPLTLSRVLIELPTFLWRWHSLTNYDRRNDEIQTMRGDKNFRYLDDNLQDWRFRVKPVMLKDLKILEAVFYNRAVEYSGWYWMPSSKIGLPFTGFDDEDKTIFNLKKK